MDSVREMREQGGGGGSYRWKKVLLRCAREIILARNLFRQAKS